MQTIQQNTIQSITNLLPLEHRNKKTIHTLIDKYFKNNGFDYVKRNVEYTNKTSKKNYRTFLIKSLENDWGLELQEDKEQDQKINIELQERMTVEFKGVKCKIECGNVIRPYGEDGGTMPEGDIRRGIKEGWIKIL
jgi:hypothetical protein